MQTSARYPWGKGTPRWARDATANDSDKTIITVPAGKMIHLSLVTVDYSATGDAGTRQLGVTITDGVNVVFRSSAYTGGIVASTRYIVSWSMASAPGQATRWNGVIGGTYEVLNSLPDIILPAGFTVRVWDGAAIQPAADDMVVDWHYIEYDV